MKAKQARNNTFLQNDKFLKNDLLYEDDVKIMISIARVNFVKQKIPASRKIKRSAVLNNGFHISECSQSNEHNPRKQTIMVDCRDATP